VRRSERSEEGVGGEGGVSQCLGLFTFSGAAPVVQVTPLVCTDMT